VEQAEAIARARQTIGVDDRAAARAYRVRRLDRSGEFYYLVVFGGPGMTIAVAAVNGASGDIESWARSSGAREHLEVDEVQARRLCRATASASAELVWKPGRVSRSPLYPVWEVRAGREVCYIDQQGKKYSAIDP
jgi:hypothetical protein